MNPAQKLSPQLVVSTTRSILTAGTTSSRPALSRASAPSAPFLITIAPAPQLRGAVGTGGNQVAGDQCPSRLGGRQQLRGMAVEIAGADAGIVHCTRARRRRLERI